MSRYSTSRDIIYTAPPTQQETDETEAEAEPTPADD